jgi:uncharacterized protein involved in exopolysaccharide biosynthesis
MPEASDIALDRRAPRSEARSQPHARRKSDMTWPYIRGAGLSVTCIWVFVIVYLTYTSPVYVSRWVLNLPGATSNVSVSLESIGQSNSTPSSPFSSASLSPKVVYKEIADGEKVRASAAQSLGLSLIEFGRPRVKLVDETALMMFEMTGRSPQEAKRRSDALIVAFNAELERLRADELEKRSVAVRSNISDYQQQSKVARENVVHAQVEAGLISANQFAEMVTGLTMLKRRILDMGGEVDKAGDEQARLSRQLGVTPQEAGIALKLAGDPGLQKVMQEFVEAATLFATDDDRFGEKHPQRLASSSRRDAALLRLRGAVARIAPESAELRDIERLTTVMNLSARSDLYATLVRSDALLEGRRRELGSLVAERTRLEADVLRLSPIAARLEELKKEQLVADAVLGSAMARLDSSKSDIYGSYPIVQVVAPPDIIETAAQPRPLYAALGGISGSFFACLAWMLAWLQSFHRWKRRKNVSSSG